jgi:hypothetical protein
MFLLSSHSALPGRSSSSLAKRARRRSKPEPPFLPTLCRFPVSRAAAAAVLPPGPSAGRAAERRHSSTPAPRSCQLSCRWLPELAARCFSLPLSAVVQSPPATGATFSSSSPGRHRGPRQRPYTPLLLVSNRHSHCLRLRLYVRLGPVHRDASPKKTATVSVLFFLIFVDSSTLKICNTWNIAPKI